MSAWITLQALILTQLPPPFSWADSQGFSSLKIEQPMETGLEEQLAHQLTEPASLPTEELIRQLLHGGFAPTASRLFLVRQELQRRFLLVSPQQQLEILKALLAEVEQKRQIWQKFPRKSDRSPSKATAYEAVREFMKWVVDPKVSENLKRTMPPLLSDEPPDSLWVPVTLTWLIQMCRKDGRWQHHAERLESLLPADLEEQTEEYLNRQRTSGLEEFWADIPDLQEFGQWRQTHQEYRDRAKAVEAAYPGEAIWKIWQAILLTLRTRKRLDSERSLNHEEELELTRTVLEDETALSRIHRQAHQKKGGWAAEQIIVGKDSLKQLEAIRGIAADTEWITLFGTPLEWGAGVTFLAERELIRKVVELDPPVGHKKKKIRIVFETAESLIARARAEDLPGPVQRREALSRLGLPVAPLENAIIYPNPDSDPHSDIAFGRLFNNAWTTRRRWANLPPWERAKYPDEEITRFYQRHHLTADQIAAHLLWILRKPANPQSLFQSDEEAEQLVAQALFYASILSKKLPDPPNASAATEILGRLIDRNEQSPLMKKAVDFLLRRIAEGEKSSERLAEALKQKEYLKAPLQSHSASGLEEEPLLGQVREKYGSRPYAFGVRIGGNNISVGLVNVAGEVEIRTSPPETPWRDLPDIRQILGNPPELKLNDRILELVKAQGPNAQSQPKARAIADRIAREAVDQIVHVIQTVQLPVENLKYLFISFPAPVDSSTGEVGVPYAAPNIPGFDHYPLAKVVQDSFQRRLGISPVVEVKNDAPAGRMGEMSDQGTAAGTQKVVAFIWGTGMNADSDAVEMFEVGHGLVGELINGLPHYRLMDTTQSRPDLTGTGKFEVEQRLGGEVLQERARQQDFEGTQEITQVAASSSSLNSDRRQQARAFIVKVGNEFGKAAAVLMAHFYDTDRFIPNRFVLTGGVAENFAKGVEDEHGRDLLIRAIQDSALLELTARFGIRRAAAQTMAGGIVRSQMDYRREFAAASQGLKRVMAQKSGLEENDGVALKERPMTSAQALAQLNKLDRFWSQSLEITLQDWIVLVDTWNDERVRLVAQALSIIKSTDDQPGLEFRLVIHAENVDEVIQELEEVNPQAVEYLRPRIVPHDGTHRGHRRARKQALEALRKDSEFRSVREMRRGGFTFREIEALTPDLEKNLREFFQPGGIKHLTDEAFERLWAVLESV